MKLNEISPIETKPLLTEKSGERWILKWLCDDLKHIQWNSDGTFDITTNVTLKTNEFRVKINKIHGNFYCDSMSLKNLNNFPDEVTGTVDISTTGIKSFEGMPKCKSINAQGCGRIKKIQDIFPYIQGPLDTLDISGCNVSDFLGIADLSKFPIKNFWFDTGEERWHGGLGVIFMKGLEKFCEPENYKQMSKPWQLIYDCFDDEDKVFQCQAALIDGGWDEMAEL